MIVDIEQRFLDKGHELNVSYIGKNGNTEFERIPIPNTELYEWQYSENSTETTFRSWDDKPVQKAKAKWLNKWRIEEFLLGQPKHITDKFYQMNIPKMCFCDIEVEVTPDGFPEPTIAKNAVTAICFSVDNKIKGMGTTKLSAVQIIRIRERLNEHFKDYGKVEFDYNYFATEYDMLKTFFGNVVKKITLLTGWNFIDFDWTYLVNRAKRLNIDPAIASKSNKVREKETQTPLHTILVDYLEIFKKWDKNIEVVEHYKLDWVADALLKIKKVSYSGNLQDLYLNDFETYIFYCAVDTYLVKLIHEKVNTMTTFLTLANITGVEVYKTYSPIWMTEKVISRLFYKENKVFPVNKNRSKKDAQFAGGLVMDPTPGYYELCVGYDAKSLYPHIMMQWNMSPETFLGMKDELDLSTLEKYTISSSGAVFNNEKDSIYRIMNQHYYGQRKAAKDEMFLLETEINELEKLLKTC